MSTTVDAPPVGYIDIDDLKHPVLSDLQRQALANAPEVTFDVDLILDLARKETGLSDFGDEDFLPRLRLWVECCNDDTGLSRVGRAGIFGMMVRYAGQRLRLEDVVRRHPEILDQPIERPVVIAGLPRSGTTHLQNFLGADPQLRSLPYWEAVRPIPTPEEVKKPGEPDPRWVKCSAEWEAADALLPLSKAMHEFSPDHISEDVELQCLDFGSYHLEFRIYAPKWRDYYLTTDQTPVYRYLKKTMQVLDFLTGSRRRWLLKCPQHIEMMIPLTNAFPDATILLTHRDPVASLQSALTAGGYGQRITRKVVDIEQSKKYWIDRYVNLLSAAVRDHDKIPPTARIVDVYFDRFMADSMAMVEEIYRVAELPMDDALRARMNGFLDANPRGKYGQVRYHMQRDFDLDPNELRGRYKFYFDAFPVKPEVK